MKELTLVELKSLVKKYRSPVFKGLDLRYKDTYLYLLMKGGTPVFKKAYRNLPECQELYKSNYDPNNPLHAYDYNYLINPVEYYQRRREQEIKELSEEEVIGGGYINIPVFQDNIHSRFYSEFGVDLDNANILTIKATFKKLAAKYHPDVNGGSYERFLQISELKDEALRYLNYH